MKKVYSLIAGLMLFAGATQAQCTIDANAQTTPGVNPTADQLPCIIRTVAYDQTLQGKIQDTKDTAFVGFATTIRVDSVSIDSIAGLPTGITWAKNPDILLGGENGCLRLTGTTTDPVGRYDLVAYGRAWLRILVPNTPIGSIDTPYAYNGNLNRFSPFGDYYLDVINQGDVCHQSVGINDFSAELNAAFSVYPNPNNGVFEIKLNAGSRVNGSVNVIDVTGRVVYTQNIDVMGLYSNTVNVTEFSKGIYTVQLRTQNGFASKNISVE
ncbi:MAG TPA: T9SS type A sorting domain-containing protein [Chitinophagales bacterium]|nr:T9SS type A sorting domain-containing protein [Chitinophagales bacterium]